MNITSEQIKLLREKTGAGMLNCKNALLEALQELTGLELVVDQYLMLV
jgi:translation elongation factor EF-Ts